MRKSRQSLFVIASRGNSGGAIPMNIPGNAGKGGVFASARSRVPSRSNRAVQCSSLEERYQHSPSLIGSSKIMDRGIFGMSICATSCHERGMRGGSAKARMSPLERHWCWCHTRTRSLAETDRPSAIRWDSCSIGTCVCIQLILGNSLANFKFLSHTGIYTSPIFCYPEFSLGARKKRVQNIVIQQFIPNPPKNIHVLLQHFLFVFASMLRIAERL